MTESILHRPSLKLFTLVALAALILFIISGLFAWTELRYALSGRTATATITGLKPAPLVAPFAMTITYTFNDPDDGPRTESHLFENDALRYAMDQKFDVIYLPKVPNSSLPITQRHRWAIPVFLTMSIALLLAIALFLRAAFKARADA